MFQGVAMPICVFDIFADGTTQVPTDTHLTGPGIYPVSYTHLTLPTNREV